jgi:hypothetical protein
MTPSDNCSVSNCRKVWRVRHDLYSGFRNRMVAGRCDAVRAVREILVAEGFRDQQLVEITLVPVLVFGRPDPARRGRPVIVDHR